jgi:hypothetical protein
MADGRKREMWDHTSALLAMTAEINRDPKKRRKPFLPSDFNPYEAKADRSLDIEVPIDFLKMFIHGAKW